MNEINPFLARFAPVYTSLTSLSQVSEKAANSVITKIEACHYPDESQRKTISSLLERFCSSNSIKEITTIKKEISKELENIEQDISDVRGQVFHLKKVNTPEVYGIIRENYTLNDRDQYIKKLMYYREAQEKIEQVTQEHHEGGFVIKIQEDWGPRLTGDMSALNELIEGRSAMVPNFTHCTTGLNPYISHGSDSDSD